MSDTVPSVNNEENIEIPEETSVCKTEYKSDMSYILKMQYRFYRKKLNSFIKKHLGMNFTEILYITSGCIPKKFIFALQKQYPDKIISVIVPLIKNDENNEKEIRKFHYFLQNKKYTGCLYKSISEADNIPVYSVYSNVFETIEKQEDIYKIKYMAHYTKCIRAVLKYIKCEIIHSENIPFFLGVEFEGIRKCIRTKKIVYDIHDLSLFTGVEPFWAIINILDKNGINRLLKDKIIKKNVSALFGIKKIKQKKLKECLNYLYEHYEEYKKQYGLDSNTNENILLKRLDKQILKLFSGIFADGEYLYNPILYSLKRANAVIINSKPKAFPAWFEELALEYSFIKHCYENNETPKIEYPFDIKNFREIRKENKRYLVKEFSQKRIEAKFTDTSLFKEEDISVHGYLDSFYNGILTIAIFNEHSKEIDIKTAVLSIFKAFELRKNIQVILNFPKDYNSEYKKSLLDFLESQSLLDGKWLVIDGEINLQQFVSSSDLILIPSSEQIGIENIFYTALQYGCIPVTVNNGICGELTTEIFDDLTKGCGFKKPEKQNLNLDEYDSILIKAINFYTQNFTSWNLLIKNAMTADTSWDFETIEKFNNIYEEL